VKSDQERVEMRKSDCESG